MMQKCFILEVAQLYSCLQYFPVISNVLISKGRELQFSSRMKILTAGITIN